jgi:hypothetical protein
MLACTSKTSQREEGFPTPLQRIRDDHRRRKDVAEIQIQDGVIRIVELDVQDQKAAAALAEYPQTRWAEITRRALKIGLGYMKGGGRD